MDSFYNRIYYIIGYIQFAIGVIGVIGNILVIIVLSRQSLRKYSYSFYCKIMAIADICLMTYTFMDWIDYNIGFDLETYGSFLCFINQFIPRYFGGVSVNLRTIITIDRMLAIVYPKRFVLVTKRWFQCLLVAIVACIVFLEALFVPLNYRLIEVNQTNLSQPIRICVVAPNNLVIEMWVIMAHFTLINIIINNVMNYKTIRFIKTSRRRVSENTSRNGRSSNKDRKFAICSICLNLSSMFLKMPLYLSILIAIYSNMSFDVITLTLKITSTISISDNGFSFIINMVVNSLFYKEFLKLFRLRRSKSISRNMTNSSFKSNNNINPNE